MRKRKQGPLHIERCKEGDLVYVVDDDIERFIFKKLLDGTGDAEVERELATASDNPDTVDLFFGRRALEGRRQVSYLVATGHKSL